MTPTPQKWSNTLKQFVDNIMALNHLDSALEEIYCTNKNRRWGIPSEAQTHEDPIMKSLIRSDSDKKGISSVSYDLRRCETDIQKISDFQKMKKELVLLMLSILMCRAKAKLCMVIL